MMPNFTRNDAGRYISQGLSERSFIQLFNKIQSEQNTNRRYANKTLTAGALTRKSAADLAKLGCKENGQPFTKQDLKHFEQERNQFKKRFNTDRSGITYCQLVSGSRDIDVKRANNQVKDGRGITRANMSGIKSNTVLVRVQASSVSVHQHHQVKIRLDDWDDCLNDPAGGNYKAAVKKACAGHLSIACDCGRHQFWYRYLATMGNYCVAPPKEFSYPKIRNPELRGVACKHVLKAAVMLQSTAWHTVLAKQMELQASRIGFGDDKKSNHVLTAGELKQANKNRSTKINQSKAQAAYAKYKKAQSSLAKHINTSHKEIEKIRQQANKIRKQSNTIKKQAQNINGMRDMLKMAFSMFWDGLKANGKITKDDAIRQYAKQMNLTESKLKKVLQ